jgi:hypothetical protein
MNLNEDKKPVWTAANGYPNEINEPKAYQEYIKIEDAVEKVIHKKSLCKILSLIISGINYNDSIAKSYYEQYSEKKFSNPKVTSIFLKELRDTNIIKRGEIQGRKQIYEVDWMGLFNIIRFRNIGNWDQNDCFKLSPWFYEPTEIQYEPKKKILKWSSPASEEAIERVCKDFCQKFFRPFIDKYVEWRLTINIKNGRTYITKTDDPWGEKVKVLSNIDFDILHLLTQFDNEMENYFPSTFEQEFRSLIKNSKISEAPEIIQFILSKYKDVFYNENLKEQYYESENPGNALLSSFNTELKTIGVQMEEMA